MNVMCVYRASCFSPNMEEKDAAIMNSVADRLEQLGHVVYRLQEEQLSEDVSFVPDKIYSMGRFYQTLCVLQQLEMNGVEVINSPIGVRNCERKQFTQILMDEDVPFSNSKVFQASESVSWDLFPCWLKKGEGYSNISEDVMYVQNYQELQRGIGLMRQRGIQTAIVSQHLDGDLVKCYGVKDSQFFHWYYAQDGHSKFGLETINGKKHGYSFSEKQLMEISNQAANVVGIDIYGVDCIVGADGAIHIIDINDWPSFSSCREKAAEIIVKR